MNSRKKKNIFGIHAKGSFAAMRPEYWYSLWR